MKIKNIKYTKYFCEENIWCLCQQEAFQDLPQYVLFISNSAKQCPFWFQKAAKPFDPILWDYHVILAVQLDGWHIFDLDTRLPCPMELDEYFTQSFLDVVSFGSNLAPHVKIIDAKKYTDEFYSDRSHMKDKNGNWLATPPSWPLIENAKTISIDDLLDFTTASKQKIYSLNEALEYFRE